MLGIDQTQAGRMAKHNAAVCCAMCQRDGPRTLITRPWTGDLDMDGYPDIVAPRWASFGSSAL